MPRQRLPDSLLAISVLRSLGFSLLLLVGMGAVSVRGDSLKPNEGVVAPTGARALHLEVMIDGAPADMVARVYRAADGRISASRGELRQIGIGTGDGDDKQIIQLDQIGGLGFRYDEADQKLHLTIPADIRLAREYNAEPPTGAIPQRRVEVSDEFGLVLNYNAYAASGRGYNANGARYSTGSLTLDSRLFSPYGVLQNTAIAGTTLSKRGVLRLDSSFVFAHQDTMTIGTLGDAVSGSLGWTRAIRYGGGQISRQFSIRPDLVTAPLPSVSGSAAVPSTVDVFVDNVRVASQQVGSGPYRINNLPVSSENGNARVVVRDVTGKETVTSLPFFTSAKLLAPGYFDFSIDAGMPRLNYAIESFDYSKRFMGMASGRYGFRNWLTLEAHAEGAAGLASGGAGAVISAGRLGLFGLAGAGSHYHGRAGGMVHASWQQSFMGVFLGASSQRTFGHFEDVASVTARKTPQLSTNLIDSGYFLIQRSPRVPKAIDRITLGIPIPDWRASLAVSFVNIERATKDRSHLLSLSYSQTFGDNYNFFVSGYGDLASKRSAGIVAGLSFTLGPDLTLSTSGAFARDGRGAGIELSRALGQKPHDYAWRLYDSEGTNSQRGASGTYRNPWARIEAGVRQDRNSVSANGELDGALVLSPSGVFASNRINDAFAVVDAGAGGIEVMHENRVIGKTDWSGKLLVPNLQSFQKARIGVNPESLPQDLVANITDTEVIPGFRGSSTVKVKSFSTRQTARVELRDAKGEIFPPGTRVRHEEADISYTIGYGGVAYLPEIDDDNTLLVSQGTSTCTARFKRADRVGSKGNVGPLTCRGE